MSREIKFRAWDEVEKKMFRVRGFSFYNIDAQAVYNITMESEDGEGIWRAINPKHFTLLQYTGLKDVNGKEVYEGDILYKRYEDKAEELGYVEVKVPVVFQEGCFGWIGDVTNQFHAFAMEPLDDYEVIGNILETPELLNPQPEKPMNQEIQIESLPVLQDLSPKLYEGATKTQIKDHADKAVEWTLEHGAPLRVAESLKAMEEFVKAVRENPRFVEGVREQVILNNGKVQTQSGAKIEVCETAIAYDYSHNPQWIQLEEQVKQLTEQKKKMEESLRRIGEGKLVVDQETGEATVGAARTSKSSYKITLAK